MFLIIFYDRGALLEKQAARAHKYYSKTDNKIKAMRSAVQKFEELLREFDTIDDDQTLSVFEYEDERLVVKVVYKPNTMKAIADKFDNDGTDNEDEDEPDNTLDFPMEVKKIVFDELMYFEYDGG